MAGHDTALPHHVPLQLSESTLNLFFFVRNQNERPPKNQMSTLDNISVATDAVGRCGPFLKLLLVGPKKNA